MPVVGVGELLVKPSFSGSQKSIGSEFAGIAKGEGKKAGGFMSNALSTALGFGIAKAGAAGLKVLGAAFTKGFGRLQAIENARAKLLGLGHSAQTVEGIMKNATAAVKGTAFGLGDAATAAANLVASGIKPGQQLEKTLTLVGDAATIAGVGFNDMSAVFAKAAASNKVQMDIINQLHDMGVPALQLIANEMGVTAEEASKMASKGEVDFATFAAAMEKGMGGAALKSGETLQGAMANAGAAIGRFGANLMSGVYPLVRDFFNGVIKFMGPMEEKAKVVGEALGNFLEKAVKGLKGAYEILVQGNFSGVLREAFGMEEDHPFVGFLFAVRDGLMETGDWIQRNRAWLEPLTVAVVVGAAAWKLYNWTLNSYKSVAGIVTEFIKKAAAAQWGWNAAVEFFSKSNIIGLIITAVVALTAAFIYLWKNNEGFRNFFIGAWEKIKSVVSTVGGFIVGVFQSIAGWVTNTLGPVFSWLHDTVIRPVWDAIAGVFRGAKSTVESTIGAAFMWLRDSVVRPVWDGIKKATEVAVGFLRTAFEGVMGALGAVGDFLRTVFGPVFSWLYDTIIKPIWGLIKWQIEFVANVLLFTFDLIVYIVRNVLGPVFTWLYNSVIKPVWSAIQSAIKNSWAIMSAIFSTVVTVVKTVLGAVFLWLRDSVIKPVWNGIQTIIAVWWAGVKTVFNTVVTFLRTVFAAVFTWFRDSVITPVWNAIKTIISLWWTGVKIIFLAVKTFLENTLGPVFRWLRDKVIVPVWNGIRDTISSVWNRGIKPVFEALSKFITDKVVPGFKKGVEMIGKVWDGLQKAAGTPVYFVMETVYNKGIKSTFDKVAKAIGSKARLPAANTSGIPHFAKGGLHKGGWALVGEEGPELVNFSQPGRVYTASETQAMLAGKQQAPLGAIDSLRENGFGQADHAGIGGFWSDTWSNIKGAASAVGGALKKGVEWVRGGLAKAAEFVLNPIKNALTNNLGSEGFAGLWSRIATNAIDGVVKWIRGKDDEWEAAGGEFGGGFTGANGGFYRPVGGTITSMFGSSRGGLPHAGTDLAVPIGTAVKAAWNGVVKKVGWNIVTGRSGIGMLLAHSGGKNTYYGHLSKTVAKPGQEVKAGQTIARSGNTGRSTGPHLHFETWQNGKPYNNIGLLRGGGGGKKASLYDSGGVLPPGLTAALNLSKKPEAILTHRQWQAISQLAARGATDFPSTMTLVVDGREFTAYVSDVAHDRMMAEKRQSRQMNRQLSGNN